MGRIKGPAFSLQSGFKKGMYLILIFRWRWLCERHTAGYLLFLLISGPGRYNPLFVPVKEPKAPAYSIQGRKEIIKPNNNPGPAQCTLWYFN